MTNVHDSGVGCVHCGWKGTIAEHVCEGRGGGDFDVGLNFIEGFAVRGITGSETVEGESVVGVVGGGHVDVGVVEVIVGEVPVGFIEADTVG